MTEANSLTLDQLFWAAQRALGVNQQGLAALMGVATRSLQRWASGATVPRTPVVRELARRLAPVDRELAGRAAEMIGASLADLGPLDDAGSGNQPLLTLAVDGLVSGAARELGIPPARLRETLRALVVRARAAGIGPSELLREIGVGEAVHPLA